MPKRIPLNGTSPQSEDWSENLAITNHESAAKMDILLMMKTLTILLLPAS